MTYPEKECNIAMGLSASLAVQVAVFTKLSGLKSTVLKASFYPLGDIMYIDIR
jgi:hypothetical protein